MAPNPSAADLARAMELTLVRPAATRADVEKLCAQARQHGLFGVCVNSGRVLDACHALEDSTVKVIAMINFPFGAADADAKRYEAETAADAGAHEIETVLNVGRLKDGDHAAILRELRDIVEAVDERPVKVIVETGLLTADEVQTACQLTLDSGAQYLSTGGGILTSAVPPGDVARLRELLGPKFGLKAAAVADAGLALSLLALGVNRISQTRWSPDPA